MVGMFALYKVTWTEYERGWGCRPDGETYYTSKERAYKAIKTYWDGMPDTVPDCYSKPSDPELVEVDEEFYHEIIAKELNHER